MLNFVEYQRRDPVTLQKTPTRPVVTQTTSPPVNSQVSMVEICTVSCCPACMQPVMFILHAPRTILEAMKAGLQGYRIVERLKTDRDVSILASYPKLEEPFVHASWPEAVRQVFPELEDDVLRGRTPGRIIAGCRSVLDVGTKALHQPDGTLYSRIEALHNAGVLTGPLKEWAHRCRLDGNEGVHELVGTPDEAKDMVAFIRLFLHVCFELPATIKERMSETEPHSTPPLAAGSA